MTKQELLNNIIEITKNTGQGLSGVVGKMNSEIQMLLDSLVKDGYITVHEQSFRTLPDDTWYMPKGCYNMWAENEPHRVLTFVRMYLGADDLGLGVQIKDLITDVEFITDYAQWLNKNFKALQKMQELKPIILKEKDGHPFSSEDLKVLKKISFYKNNNNIKECLELIDKRIKDNQAVVTLIEQLIPLYESNMTKYKEMYDKESTSLKKCNVEIIALQKLKSFLKGKTGKIKTHLK